MVSAQPISFSPVGEVRSNDEPKGKKHSEVIEHFVQQQTAAVEILGNRQRSSTK